jgi:hypothetical protein
MRATLDILPGLPFEVQYLDRNAQLTLTAAGHAGYRVRYGAFHKIVQVEYFGLDGRPVMSNGQGFWYATHRIDRNRSGQVLLDVYLDASGFPVPDDRGRFGLSCHYDNNGALTDEVFLSFDEARYLVRAAVVEN